MPELGKPPLLRLGRVALKQALEFARQGKLREFLELIKDDYLKKEVDLDKFADSLLNLIWQFGWLAPASEFRPPIGGAEWHKNIIVVIEPGVETTLCNILKGPLRQHRVRKWREITVTPLNTTAQDSVRFTEEIFLPTGGDPDLSGIACFNAAVGDFSTVQNINMPFGAKVDLGFNNTDAFSQARLQVEAISWED